MFRAMYNSLILDQTQQSTLSDIRIAFFHDNTGRYMIFIHQIQDTWKKSSKIRPQR